MPLRAIVRQPLFPTLVWRGTRRNTERSGPKLSAGLSGDLRKLLSKFPPKRR